MKQNRIYTLVALLPLFLVTNCLPEDNVDTSKNVISIDNNENLSQFDKYLEKNYVEPYNIEFIYKWDGKQTDRGYELVPAKYENSIKMANLIKYLCLDAYDAVAPKDFLKKYFPKNIMLIGSPAYNNNGTFVLGTAEGGVRITLYNINDLNTENVEMLYRFYFRTIFHEFSHILHQTVEYSKEFEKVCGGDYTGDTWNSKWAVGESLQKGFISDYSSKDTNEDFVELIAHYVTYTPEKWNQTVEAAGEVGGLKIKQKMGIIKKYLAQIWKIDLDSLRTEVLTRAENLKNIDLTNIEIKN